MISVQVIKIPNIIKTVMLDEGASVVDALNAAGLAQEGNEAIKVNGADADLSTTVSTGDKVYLAKGAKGNS